MTQNLFFAKPCFLIYIVVVANERYVVQFTVDLPTQIFVTWIRVCSKPLIPYLIDSLALYRVANFRLPRDIDVGNPPDRLIS